MRHNWPEGLRCVITPNPNKYDPQPKTWSFPITVRTIQLRSFSIRMKKAKTTVRPLNNNIVVRQISATTEELRGGIIVPKDSTASSPTVEVEIVAISSDIKPPNGEKLSAKVGDRALIHHGVLINSTKIQSGGETLLVIGYVNLIATV